MNVSAEIGEPFLGVSPPLEVAPLFVAPPLEVAQLMRSSRLPVVQVWVRVGLGCKQGRSGGVAEADWEVFWVGWV